MNAGEVALATLEVAVGIVGAFVLWTYVAPHLAGQTSAAALQPAA
jgi:hypothetical protein